MGYTKDIQDDLIALAERDGAVIEQREDGSRTVTPVVPVPVSAPAPVVRPAQTAWSD